MGTPCWMVMTTPDAGDKILLICREETGVRFTMDVSRAPVMCQTLSCLVPRDQGRGTQRRVLQGRVHSWRDGSDVDAGARLELAGPHSAPGKTWLCLQDLGHLAVASEQSHVGHGAQSRGGSTSQGTGMPGRVGQSCLGGKGYFLS